MLVCFELSMPTVNSWNGGWSGEEEYYAIVKYLGRSKEDIEKTDSLDGKYFTYRFTDGWMAAVSTKVVDSKEAQKIRRKSKGFYGYDWMVDSIIENGFIKERKEKP